MVFRKSKTSRESGAGRAGERGERPARSVARTPKKKRPLDETALRDLALSYVARFATTGAKLEQYLARKLRERGVAEDADGRAITPDITGLVTRFVELGYIDDAAYARSRSRDLTARGYGARRVERALWAAGVEEEVRQDSAPGEAASRRAAAMLAQKRRFGPYAIDRGEELGRDERHKRREKQVAAMLRAGHLYEHVRFILDAEEPADIDEWLIEAEDDEAAGEDFR
ncbi:regulatory protein RecX [Qipengyuania nanhaisediminis]|uniref:regulatory protein RecX n=1 Tax=Qipengyuania nanhaisediminis TaxID=604088 RepID=UPI0038B37986